MGPRLEHAQVEGRDDRQAESEREAGRVRKGAIAGGGASERQKVGGTERSLESRITDGKERVVRVRVSPGLVTGQPARVYPDSLWLGSGPVRVARVGPCFFRHWHVGHPVAALLRPGLTVSPGLSRWRVTESARAFKFRVSVSAGGRLVLGRPSRPGPCLGCSESNLKSA